MAYSLSVTLRAPDDTEEKTFVVTTTELHADIVAASIEAVAIAAKDYASSQTDYDSFGNDSAYLDRLDQIVSGLEVVGLSKPITGKTPIKFLVDGTYSDYPEGGAWSDHVIAIDAEDAELQAKYTMALNEQEGTLPAVADFSNFVAVMDEEIINGLTLEPVSQDELLFRLRQLVAAGSALIENPEANELKTIFNKALDEARSDLKLVDDSQFHLTKNNLAVVTTDLKFLQNPKIDAQP